MKGNEYIKQKRIEKGYSVQEFAKLAGISYKSMAYYQKGERSLGSMPVYKSFKFFGLLDIPVTDFFNEYYPFSNQLDEFIGEWRMNNPIDYRYNTIKRRLYDRLCQIKIRKSIDEGELDELFGLYNSFFKSSFQYRDTDLISTSDYEEYVRPLYYKIKCYMDKKPGNAVGIAVVDALHKTDYKLKDVCDLCGISVQSLNYYINDKNDFKLIHTYTALKICHVLDLDFDIVFGVI